MVMCSLLHTGLERIWIVGSMNPASTMGRQPLASRLAALFHVAYMGYPAPDDLLSIYSSMMAASLRQVRPGPTKATSCEFLIW